MLLKSGGQKLYLLKKWWPATLVEINMVATIFFPENDQLLQIRHGLSMVLSMPFPNHFLLKIEVRNLLLGL